MPLDVQLTLYNQVWALLEVTGSAFTTLVSAASRLKSTAHNQELRDRTGRDPASFPKVRIDVSDASKQRAARVFGMSRTNFSSSTCNYGVPMRLNVEIRVVYEQTNVTNQTPVEAAILAQLNAKGENLGLAWVSNFEIVGVSRKNELDPDSSNSLRTVSRMRLVVNARPLLSQLTT